MAVSVTCPGCRTSYPVTDDLLGKKIRCKKCQETFTATAGRNGTAKVADERIQTRPGATKTAARGDDGPTNGRTAIATAPKAGNHKTLIVMAAGAGALLAGMGAITVWALNRNTDKDNPVVVAPPPAPRLTPPVIPNTPEANDTKIGSAPTPPPNIGGSTLTTPPSTDPADAAMRTVNALLNTGKRPPRPADFRPSVVDRALKSAVMIRCTNETGAGYGSGWIAEKNGQERYIVTNAHVVQMKEPANPAPEKLEVFIHSGTPEQRILEGKLLAVDREEDLAVIRIKAADLPEPLVVVPSYDLAPAQKIITLGFPHGGMLAREVGVGANAGVTVKTRPSTVVGRIPTGDGGVKYIQVEGGVDPGNSGGAVIDTNGDVVAVVVAQLTGTNMKFVIPSEYVIHLLHGRVLKITAAQAVRTGGGIRQPMTAQFADPMGRLRKVTAEVWAGKPGKARPSASRKPDVVAGDGKRSAADLAYDQSKPPALGESYTASFEMTLPALGDGEVYWFQPHYTDRDGQERWGEAVVMEMGRHPVEAKPVALALKYKKDLRPEDARQLKLNLHARANYNLEGLSNTSADENLSATLTERTLDIEPNGNAKIRYQYSDLRLGDNDTDTAIRKQLRGVLESVKGFKTEVTVTPNGRFTSSRPDVAQVPQEAREILKVFNKDFMEALESLTLQLPNKTYQPGETATSEVHFTVSFQGVTTSVTMPLTLKYVGTRMRDDREEAVIEITSNAGGANNRGNNRGGDRGGKGGAPPLGSIQGGGGFSTPFQQPPPGQGRPGGPGGDNVAERRQVRGSINGAAIVDVLTGQIVLSRLITETSTEFPVMVRNTQNNRVTSVKVFVGFHQEEELIRSLTKDPPKAVVMGEILPNQPRVYNPMVGTEAPVAEEPSASISSYPTTSTALPAEVFDKVQKSVVMINVTTSDGGGSGSGWFAGPGVVVTNCHVVQMLSRSDREPEKIEVVLDIGTPSERRLPGKVMLVDRVNDLAAIRVTGDNLPEPLKIKPSFESADLPAATVLTVLGFPLGNSRTRMLQGLGARDLKTTVTARPTTVTGRMYAVDESVKYIQLEGGADRGNSGGPIVDAEGAVRAVLVAGIDGTELRWAIPSEYANRIVQGYPLEVEPGRPYLDGSASKQPIDIKLADPMQRISKVALDVWVGPDGKPRKPSATEPKPVDGDGAKQTFVLKYDAAKMTASGEFPFPETGPGRVVWFQPRVINGTGKEEWSQATRYTPDGPPVERKPAKLVFTHNRANAERVLDLTSISTLRWQRFEKVTQEGYPIKATLVEKALPRVPPNVAAMRGFRIATGDALQELRITDLSLDLAILGIRPDDQPDPDGPPADEDDLRAILRAAFQPLTSLIKGVTTYATVTREGVLKDPKANIPPASAALAIIPTFNNQVMHSLAALSFPLPNKEVPFGHTWEHKTNLFIPAKTRLEASLFKMNLKYVGVREHAGRQEAVIEISGTLAQDTTLKSIDAKDIKGGTTTPPAGGAAANPGGDLFQQPVTPKPKDLQTKRGLYGLAKGYAYFDVANGYVTEVKLFIDLDVELMVKDAATKTNVPVMATGSMDLLLRRLGK